MRQDDNEKKKKKDQGQETKKGCGLRFVWMDKKRGDIATMGRHENDKNRTGRPVSNQKKCGTERGNVVQESGRGVIR